MSREQTRWWRGYVKPLEHLELLDTLGSMRLAGLRVICVAKINFGHRVNYCLPGLLHLYGTLLLVADRALHLT